MTKTSCYIVFSGPGIHLKPRTRKKARAEVKRLVAAGHYVICDQQVITRKKFCNVRLFRNDPEFPLNALKA